VGGYRPPVVASALNPGSGVTTTRRSPGPSRCRLRATCAMISSPSATVSSLKSATTVTGSMGSRRRNAHRSSSSDGAPPRRQTRMDREAANSSSAGSSRETRCEAPRRERFRTSQCLPFGPVPSKPTGPTSASTPLDSERKYRSRGHDTPSVAATPSDRGAIRHPPTGTSPTPRPTGRPCDTPAPTPPTAVRSADSGSRTERHPTQRHRRTRSQVRLRRGPHPKRRGEHLSADCYCRLSSRDGVRHPGVSNIVTSV